MARPTNLSWDSFRAELWVTGCLARRRKGIRNPTKDLITRILRAVCTLPAMPWAEPTAKEHFAGYSEERGALWVRPSDDRLRRHLRNRAAAPLPADVTGQNFKNQFWLGRGLDARLTILHEEPLDPRYSGWRRGIPSLVRTLTAWEYQTLKLITDVAKVESTGCILLARRAEGREGVAWLARFDDGNAATLSGDDRLVMLAIGGQRTSQRRDRGTIPRVLPGLSAVGGDATARAEFDDFQERLAAVVNGYRPAEAAILQCANLLNVRRYGMHREQLRELFVNRFPTLSGRWDAALEWLRAEKWLSDGTSTGVLFLDQPYTARDLVLTFEKNGVADLVEPLCNLLAKKGQLGAVRYASVRRFLVTSIMLTATVPWGRQRILYDRGFAKYDVPRRFYPNLLLLADGDSRNLVERFCAMGVGLTVEHNWQVLIGCCEALLRGGFATVVDQIIRDRATTFRSHDATTVLEWLDRMREKVATANPTEFLEWYQPAWGSTIESDLQSRMAVWLRDIVWEMRVDALGARPHGFLAAYGEPGFFVKMDTKLWTATPYHRRDTV